MTPDTKDMFILHSMGQILYKQSNYVQCYTRYVYYVHAHTRGLRLLPLVELNAYIGPHLAWALENDERCLVHTFNILVNTTTVNEQYLFT